MNIGRIVIVEDERSIREGIGAALRAAGYDAVEAVDGPTGLAAACAEGVDLVLLDLMLPKMDGLEVLRRLRQTRTTLPVIILTARGGEDDRVDGLRRGADDYIVKPFSARELVARVEAVLRRSPERSIGVTRLRLVASEVDFERREVVGDDGGRVALSETECAILGHLAGNPGRAISRDELLQRLWGIGGGGVETRTVDMHVARLRGKLAEVDGEDGEAYVVTVRGRGYMLGPRAMQAGDADSAPRKRGRR